MFPNEWNQPMLFTKTLSEKSNVFWGRDIILEMHGTSVFYKTESSTHFKSTEANFKTPGSLTTTKDKAFTSLPIDTRMTKEPESEQGFDS